MTRNTFYDVTLLIVYLLQLVHCTIAVIRKTNTKLCSLLLTPMSFPNHAMGFDSKTTLTIACKCQEQQCSVTLLNAYTG